MSIKTDPIADLDGHLLLRQLSEMQNQLNRIEENIPRVTFKRQIPYDSSICSFGYVDYRAGFKSWITSLLEDPLTPRKEYSELDKGGNPTVIFANKLGAFGSDLDDLEDAVFEDQLLEHAERKEWLTKIQRRRKQIEEYWKTFGKPSQFEIPEDWLITPRSGDVSAKDLSLLKHLNSSHVYYAICCFFAENQEVLRAQQAWKHFTTSKDTVFYDFVERDDPDDTSQSRVDDFRWESLLSNSQQGELSEKSFKEYVSRLKGALKQHPEWFDHLFDRAFGKKNWKFPVIK